LSVVEEVFVNPRIQQLFFRFPEYKVDAYLVTKSVNITYLTKFPSADSWLLIFPKKSFYVTDFRYLLDAQEGLTNIVVRPYRDSMVKEVFRIIKQMKAKSIGFDEQHVSLDVFKRLKKDCPKGVKLIPRNNAVECLREIKDGDEIRRIREAIELNLKAYQYLAGFLKPGLTENEVLFCLERYVRAKGAKFSFEPIIASGENSCFPHARVTTRRLQKDEPVLIDVGIELHGYTSDLTRMFFLGKIPPPVEKVYQIVEVAQRQAIQKIKPGISAASVDQEARNYIKKKGLARYFGHSLGHGVGLQVHEGPRISQKSPAILKEGMVFTVEPGVYIPHKFGVRIEDMVLVTRGGCEVLSRPK
jgi:Xaa-Pro aminopeptidase